MTYDLYIADRSFSSWSLRGWLMLRKFGLEYRSHNVGLYTGTWVEDMAALAPARTVPVMRTPEGEQLTDSLAMAETLAERHPNAGLWPTDPAARTMARNLVAEMHSGFGALRTDCGMMLKHAWDGFTPSDALRADLERIEQLWTLARSRFGQGGPWLLGQYSLADVFYAPVATRIATYQLPVGPDAKAYVDHHLADGDFRQWRAMGETVRYDPNPYAMPLGKAPWPGPAPIAAKLTDKTDAENSLCPYSELPVTHFLETDGRVFGFCNAFCRDKTIADPGAWPAFMDLLSAR